MFGLWAHEACHKLPSSEELANNMTRDHIDDILHICHRRKFRNMYEHILSTGMRVSSVQCAAKVEHRCRQAIEDESRQWLAENHPDIEYQGITAREWTDQGPMSFPAPERPYYYPIHRVEPFEGNKAVYDYDTYFSSSALIDKVRNSWKPSLSAPYKSIQNREIVSAFLTHPGAKTSVLFENPQAVAYPILWRGLVKI